MTTHAMIRWDAIDAKAATRGNWNEVRDSFDSRKLANAFNNVVAEAPGNDMFGVAAEWTS